MTALDKTKIHHAASVAHRVAKGTAADFERARVLAEQGNLEECSALLAVLMDQVEAARDALRFAGIVPASAQGQMKRTA